MRHVDLVNDRQKGRRWVAVDRETKQPLLRLADLQQLRN